MNARIGTFAAFACAGIFVLSLFACTVSRNAGDPFPVLPLWWGDNVRLLIAADRTSWGLYYVGQLDRAKPPDGWRGGRLNYSALGFQLNWQEWGMFGLPLVNHAAFSATVGVPSLVVLPLLALVPVRHCLRHRTRRERARRGLCIQCGYDLCCTPDRCPECGAAP